MVRSKFRSPVGAIGAPPSPVAPPDAAAVPSSSSSSAATHAAAARNGTGADAAAKAKSGATHLRSSRSPSRRSSGRTLGGRAAPAMATLAVAASAVVAAYVAWGLGGVPVLTGAHFTSKQLWALREEAREMFYHAYDNYMEHAYPWDELKPLSCEGRRWDRRTRGDLDDALGGYSTTLVDALDMLVVVGDYEEFRRAVRLVAGDVTFDRNVTVSVFETTIRIVGGLLSGHLLASDPELALMPEYDGALLRMAVDLGERLLPAFDTPTGIPVHRVNLVHGVGRGEKEETCTAAAGTLLVELGLLSRLTGRPEFEEAALGAVYALWARRTSLDLVGSTISVKTGYWRSQTSGIGAGVDSFYEYLLKASILLGSEELSSMFYTARAAVNDHMLFGSIHCEVNIELGRAAPRPPVVSSLQAFWPAMEVLAGDVERARDTYRPLAQLWRKYEALPEAMDVVAGGPLHFAKDAPLRPELLESTYHLYLATRDPSYLRRGATVMRSIQEYSRVDCGYASIADVASKRLDDRMDSYFLSETVKYLFMLFDAALDDAEVGVGVVGAAVLRDGAGGADVGGSSARVDGGGGAVGATMGSGQFPGGDAAAAGAGSGSEATATAAATAAAGAAGLCVSVDGGVQDPQCLAGAGSKRNASSPSSHAGGLPVATADAIRVLGGTPLRHNYRDRTRNGRSARATARLDPGDLLFTTEGHIVRLTAPAVQNVSDGTCLNPERAPVRDGKRKSRRLRRVPTPAVDDPHAHECPVWDASSASWFSDLLDDWVWASAVPGDDGTGHAAPPPPGAAASSATGGGGDRGTGSDKRRKQRRSKNKAGGGSRAKRRAASVGGADGIAGVVGASGVADPSQPQRPSFEDLASEATTLSESARRKGSGPQGQSAPKKRKTAISAPAHSAAVDADNVDAGTGASHQAPAESDSSARRTSALALSAVPDAAAGAEMPPESVTILRCVDGVCAAQQGMPALEFDFPVRAFAAAADAHTGAGVADAESEAAAVARPAAAKATLHVEHSATAGFGGALPVSPNMLRSHALQVADPALGCAAMAPFHGGVAVVLRGRCSFVEKVRRAQRAGAVAAIVLDGEAPASGDGDGGGATGGGWSLVMGDDGTAGDVVIPSVLLPPDEGLALLHAIGQMLQSGGVTGVSTGGSALGEEAAFAVPPATAMCELPEGTGGVLRHMWCAVTAAASRRAGGQGDGSARAVHVDARLYARPLPAALQFSDAVAQQLAQLGPGHVEALREAVVMATAAAAAP